MSDHIPLKGDHVVNLRISWELKSRLQELAERERRSLSDICRILLMTGLPILEGVDRARSNALADWPSGNFRGQILAEES